MTSIETALQTASAICEAWTKETTTPEPSRVDIRVEADDLLAAVQALYDANWGYLSAITGMDLGVDKGEMVVLYHFCEGAAVFTLRVYIPRDDPKVPSVYGIIPSVSFYERELIEMFGIDVVDTPNRDRLFTPDDWPDGIYPMRKDFEHLQGS